MKTQGEQKYATPHQWFLENYNKLSPEKFHSAISKLILQIDPDEIQFLFEKEMDEDGYFDE